MKFHGFVLALITAHGTVLATTQLYAAHQTPHLEMEMTGREYLNLLENGSAEVSFKGPSQREEFQEILAMGKRFYQWVDKINNARPAGQKLTISTAATQHAYPIESPRLSNPKRINDSFTDLRQNLPKWMTGILLDGEEPTTDVPVTDDEFATYGRQVTDVYEAASRWVLEAPDLDYYASRKSDDVRGYYFLGKEANLADELGHWSTLEAGKQKQLSEWLVNDCTHSGTSEASCQKELQGGDAATFYKKYLADALRKWNEYFDITVHRSDIDWPAGRPNQMNVPFQPPSVATIKQFLAENIEDEWKFGAWQLRLAFNPKAAAHLEFEAGATPHVNDLAGDIITMDQNAPLTEYDVQWTIRHEFGHVIGFPDCYLEFYDKASETMVSYQLDISNLMCSRRGHLQQRHVDELKRVYYRG